MLLLLLLLNYKQIFGISFLLYVVSFIYFRLFSNQRLSLFVVVLSRHKSASKKLLLLLLVDSTKDDSIVIHWFLLSFLTKIIFAVKLLKHIFLVQIHYMCECILLQLSLSAPLCIYPHFKFYYSNFSLWMMKLFDVFSTFLLQFVWLDFLLFLSKCVCVCLEYRKTSLLCYNCATSSRFRFTALFLFFMAYIIFWFDLCVRVYIFFYLYKFTM